MNISQAAELLESQGFVRIISHNDADGICSAGILCHALYRERIGFHVSILGNLDSKLMELHPRDEFLVICDMGSMHPAKLNSLGRDVLVIDHHTPTPGIQIPYLNSWLLGIDGSFDISASGLCYLVAKELSPRNLDLCGLALVGALGDKQALQGNFNQRILEEGMRHGYLNVIKAPAIDSGKLSQVLERTAEPYFEFSGNPEKVREFVSKVGIDGDVFQMDESQRMRVSSFIALELLRNSSLDILELMIGNAIILHKELIKDGFKFSKMLTGLGKMGRSGLGLGLCLRDPSVVEEANHVYLQFQRIMLYELSRARREIMQRRNFRYVYTQTRSVTGPLTSALVRYLFTDKPVLALNRMGDETKISARATREMVENGLDLAKAVACAAERLGGSGGGHNIACGASIPSSREMEFLEILDSILDEYASKIEAKSSPAGS